MLSLFLSFFLRAVTGRAVQLLKGQGEEVDPGLR
jgi:hypothetical protein